MKNYFILIKNFFIKNTKPLIFLLAFLIVCNIYFKNSQTLNYILKRGTILEYSIKADSTNKEKIRKHLADLGIKYSYINEADKSRYDEYDCDKNRVEKSLYVAVPIIAKENKTELFNNISDFVFDNYSESKLTSVKTLNNNYHEPYRAFLVFLNILFISLFLWILLLFIFFNPKKVTKEFINNSKEFFKTKKQNTEILIQKTKEKGTGYFLKKLLLDDGDDEKETDLTKELLSTIIFVVVCVIIIRYFIGELRWIPSGSMHPVILEHDRVFVEKLNYPTKKEIERGDILVFYPPQSELSNSFFAVLSRLSGIFCKDVAYIKRVIGMPGEKFEVKYDENINEYRVYINDRALNEPYINSKSDWTPCSENMYCGPFIIPENNYFMMGDNRGNSQDSRFWGFLDKNRIIGRANFMFFPISRINPLRDKYLKLHEEKSQTKPKDRDYIIDRYEFLYKI